MLIFRVFSLLVLLLISEEMMAQKFLAVDSRTSIKRWKYSEGDLIMLKLNDQSKIGGQISLLKDSSFMIGKKEIRLSDIKSIHLRGHRYGLGIITNVCLIAGAGYFSLDTFNRLINSDDPLVYEGTIVTSGMLFSVAIISDLLNRKRIRIKDSKQIKVLDISV